jgi:hypothetical protein
MRVLVNKLGQVLQISDSHLVANASFIKQEYITFVIQGLNEQERERLKVGFLSVVRQDGFSINDLIMGREVDEETNELIFSHKVLDSSQIFAVAGQIQVSLQAKGLRKEFELLGLPESEANYENYCTLASCTVVGYVQRNNGTEEEYDLVTTKINSAVANLQMSVADSQNKADKAMEIAEKAATGGVISVAGKKGEVTLTPSDVGLGEVENKPMDAAPQSGSGNYISSGAVNEALKGKQDNLSFDSAPIENSQNPVTSDGIHKALEDRLPKTTKINGKGVSNGSYNLTPADVGALPSNTVIPYKTSQLENDSGYLVDANLTAYDATIKQYIANAIAGAVTTALNTAV